MSWQIFSAIIVLNTVVFCCYLISSLHKLLSVLLNMECQAAYIHLMRCLIVLSCSEFISFHVAIFCVLGSTVYGGFVCGISILLRYVSFDFPVRVRRRPCCLGLGCEAIRFRAAAYSRFAGRDVDLRAVMW